jgi:pilus assembly protein FimV
VHEIPYKTWLCAAFLLLMPWVAHAAGLGKLTVLSALGQPLLAEIDLMSVQKDELSTLTARIASPEAFQQANIQFSPALLGARVSIERRSDGKPYIKIISLRTVSEPFIDVLVELSWAQGRLVREYTALVDPPGYSPTAPVATPMVVPPVAPGVGVAPAPQPVEPMAAAPSPKGSASRGPAPGPAGAATPTAGEYAVKRGDTLARIAAGTKPEGVTLEQMLVSLYRNNTNAFAGNMNRLKTGTILRVPEKASIVETAQPDAVKEVRVQAANWNAYRLKLAEAAGNAPAQTGKAASSGKIVTAVEDKAAGKAAPKEVLKLSKGDTAAAGKGKTGGKPISAQDRVRMLEEEATAREKSLAEANERVSQLEKNIKDMQRLLEMKGVVPGAKPAVPATTPGKSDQAPKGEAPPAPPAKAEPPKAGAAATAPGKDAAKPTVEAPKADKAVTEPPKGEAPKGEAPKADAPKADQTAPPKPKPKIVAPPPPPPPPELIDEVISAASDPAILGSVLGGVVLLGGIGYWLARRRRNRADDNEPAGAKTAPTLRKPAAAAAAAAAVAEAPVAAAPPTAAADDVDPLAEADLYLNFGRDAQAEEVLKEALEKNPRHEEAQLKLLQIYAGRKDKAEFEKIARKLNAQTSGAGQNWLKAAAMGYGFDPDNALYSAGQSAPTVATPAAGGAPASTDLDFDLELAPGTNATETDVPLEIGTAEKTTMMQPGVLSAMAAVPPDATATQDISRDSAARSAVADSGVGAAPDFTLGAGTGTETDIVLDAGPDPTVKIEDGGEPAAMTNAIDFNFDATTALHVPASPPAEPKHDSTLIMTPEHQEKAAALGMDFDIGGAALTEPAKAADETMALPALDADFKLDLGGDAPAAPLAPEFKFDDINVNLDDTPRAAAAPAAGGAKDDHWYDVQTKFDLAKAYQEMGDKDGAREILQEVIKEGDAAQQAEAKQLLDSLG